MLLNGHIEDAKRHLLAAESWRYGKESTDQYQKVKLIQAYRSLLDYIIWCDKKFTLSGDSKAILCSTPQQPKASFIYVYWLRWHTCKLLFDVTLPPTGQK